VALERARSSLYERLCQRRSTSNHGTPSVSILHSGCYGACCHGCCSSTCKAKAGSSLGGRVPVANPTRSRNLWLRQTIRKQGQVIRSMMGNLVKSVDVVLKRIQNRCRCTANCAECAFRKHNDVCLQRKGSMRKHAFVCSCFCRFTLWKRSQRCMQHGMHIASATCPTRPCSNDAHVPKKSTNAVARQLAAHRMHAGTFTKTHGVLAAE
jgi:hypothetical protein